MRKATGIVAYHGTKIYALSVITRNGEMVPLITYGRDDPPPYDYPHWNDLYKAVIDYAKHNGFEFNWYQEFGAKWYNIVWYDINNPTKHQRFGYREAVV